MRLRRALPAGMVDAGFSSVATFMVGFYAARSLSPEALGGYAIFFSAFLLVTVVPAQLLLTPAEIDAVTVPRPQRLGLLRQTLRLTLPWSVLCATASLVAVALVPREVPSEAVRALAVTTVPAAVLSPLQDHVRRMLHIAQRSWGAAGVSVAQAAGAALGIVLLMQIGVPTAAVPFGALTLANLGSLVAGLLLGRSGQPAQHRLRTRELLHSGRWLLVVGLAPTVAGLVSATLVGRLASAASLGYAEAARVVAQPLLVVAAGLGAVLGPRLMESAARHQKTRVTRDRRVFVVALGVLCVAYAAATAVPWIGNPFATLLPSAYVVSGLVAATVAANLLNGLAFPYRYELMGRHREPSLARGELLGGAGQVAASATAGLTDAFAKPLGLGALGLLRLGAFLHSARQLSPSETQDHAQ